MKNLCILLALVQFVGFHLFAQNAPSPTLNKTEIIGVWQINSPRVGNGFSECFSFFKDGTFIYQYDPSDDTRNILSLKGKYRLDDDKIYLTVTSRTERIGGKIAAGAVGTDEYLFIFDNNKLKQTQETAPKELDPFFISKVNKKAKIDCYINNRHYYKVSADPNKIKSQ